MKTSIIVIAAVLSLASVLALPMERPFTDEMADEGWYVPQLDGTFKWTSFADRDQDVEHELQGRAKKPIPVEFYLYTQSNPDEPEQLIIGDVKGLKNSNFDKKYPTRFIIHGWQNSYKSDVNTEIRDAFLSTGKYNVISVNWSKKSKKLNYATSAKSVPEVGRTVAAMIDFLVDSGKMSLKTLNLIGHSLGAHVAGHAGKNVASGEVHTIIGLDPALPLFKYNDCDERLCDTDAKYVESIQTNGGLLGFLRPIGKAIFYPNGGKSQPGCGLDMTGACSHERSYLYFAEAIRGDYFTSLKCTDWEKAVKKACDETVKEAKLGNPNNYKYALGSFLTPVSKKAPYGMG